MKKNFWAKRSFATGRERREEETAEGAFVPAAGVGAGSGGLRDLRLCRLLPGGG